jgi:type VI secretion system protein ImpF
MPDYIKRTGTESGHRAGSDRLRPTLLDRLTDAAPTQRSESVMPGTHQAELRAAVLRDLSWLFNATSLAADFDLAQFPYVSRSVLNYGVLPLAGRRISELDGHELASILRLTILQFEPRLLPDSVEVICINALDALALRNEIAFEIRGLLWSVPYPLEFVARSNVELDTGYTSLSDLVGR